MKTEEREGKEVIFSDPKPSVYIRLQNKVPFNIKRNL